MYHREKGSLGDTHSPSGPLPQESVSQRERSSSSGECIAERKVLSLRRVYRREKGSLPQVSVSQRERFSPSGECIAERKVLSLRRVYRREKGSLPQVSVSQSANAYVTVDPRWQTGA